MSQPAATESKVEATPPTQILPQLVWYFLRLGTWGFGGPIALAGYMQRDLVEEKRWFTRQEFLDGLALAQLAPGPLAAQLAMYLGLLRGGMLGASLVAVAFIAPSFLMVMALSFFYVKFGGLPLMQAAFYGVGAAVVAIIARSAIKLIKTAIGKDKLLWCIFLVLLAATAITEREIVWLFLAGGLVSLLVKARPRLSPSLSSFALLTAGSVSTGASLFFQILLFFTKASLFVFGSGLAIVPFLHGGIVLERHWLTEHQFIDAVAVAMITPGPVVITVGFIGYIIHGWSGAVAAALGVFLPVYLVVVIAGPFYKKFAGNPQLRAFVQGVTAAATGAIAGAIIVLARRSVTDVPTILIAVISLLLLFKWKIPEPLLISAAAIAGLFLHR
jgi:chromate transporter